MSAVRIDYAIQRVWIRHLSFHHITWLLGICDVLLPIEPTNMPKTSCTTVSAVKKTVFTISPFILEESFSHPRKQQNMMSSYVYIYSSVSVWVLDCKYYLTCCLFGCVGVVFLLWLFDFYDMINNNLSPDRPRYRSRYVKSVTKTGRPRRLLAARHMRRTPNTRWPRLGGQDAFSRQDTCIDELLIQGDQGGRPRRLLAARHMRRTPNLARSEGSRVKEGVTKFACTSFPKTSGFYGIARHGRFPIPSETSEHTVVGVVACWSTCFTVWRRQFDFS